MMGTSVVTMVHTMSVVGSPISKGNYPIRTRTQGNIVLAFSVHDRQNHMNQRGQCRQNGCYSTERFGTIDLRTNQQKDGNRRDDAEDRTVASRY